MPLSQYLLCSDLPDVRMEDCSYLEKYPGEYLEIVPFKIVYKRQPILKCHMFLFSSNK